MGAVRSFDVFDTVVTRRLGDPHRVADLLAERLVAGGLDVPVAAFAAARRRWETELTPRLGRHAGLREIHGEVARSLCLDPARAEEWARAEEQLERELVLPLPGAQERVLAARRQGPVVFVSDTPHAEAFLRDLLSSCGILQPEDRVFTSSARGTSKLHGGLFTTVGAELGGAERFHHEGDNLVSDVAAARAEGWTAQHTPAGSLGRYERALEQHSRGTAGATSWWAGASRLARLEAVDRGVPAPLAEVSSGPLAALVVGFATWVAAQAQARGVRRLYYVARDGEVMLAAARHVLGRIAPELELRYLHSSRKPWIFGAAATSEELLAGWVRARPDYSARTLLERVDLTPEQVQVVAPLDCCAPGRADQVLLPAERDELAAALQSPPLVDLVRRNGAAVAERAVAYLRQEGLDDGTPSALVDAGWGGSAAYAVDHLLRGMGAQPVVHLFVGTRGSAADLGRRSTSQVVPWLFDEQATPASVRSLPSPHTLVETLCAGTTGRTLDYRSEAGRWVPVLESPENGPVVAWGIVEVQRVAARVAELLADPAVPTPSTNVDLVPAVTALLREFWVRPSAAEAEAWGSFPWQEETTPPFAPLAQRMTTREVVARRWRGERHVRRVNSWRAGSAAASPLPWSGLLRLRGWQLENDARVRRIPRRLRLELALRRRR